MKGALNQSRPGHLVNLVIYYQLITLYPEQKPGTDEGQIIDPQSR